MLNTYDNFTLNSIFRPKDFCRNIELRVKLSYVINNLTCRRNCVIFICSLVCPAFDHLITIFAHARYGYFLYFLSRQKILTKHV